MSSMAVSEDRRRLPVRVLNTQSVYRIPVLYRRYILSTSTKYGMGAQYKYSTSTGCSVQVQYKYWVPSTRTGTKVGTRMIFRVIANGFLKQASVLVLIAYRYSVLTARYTLLVP